MLGTSKENTATLTKAKKQGWAFELRLWDARLGRWLTTDPEGVHHSPYLGMANNPIRKIDPDGGSPLDIIYRTYNTTTGRYDTALIIKSDVVYKVFDVHLPISIKDPITGSGNLLPPRVIEGFDKVAGALGMPDALKLSITLDGAVGFGAGTSFDVVSFISGSDSGLSFAYVPLGGGGPISFLGGLGYGVSIEAGLIFNNSSDFSNFNRFTLEGNELSIGGSWGPVAMTLFSAIDFSYRGATMGRGIGSPFSVAATIWAPADYLLDININPPNFNMLDSLPIDCVEGCSEN